MLSARVKTELSNWCNCMGGSTPRYRWQPDASGRFADIIEHAYVNGQRVRHDDTDVVYLKAATKARQFAAFESFVETYKFERFTKPAYEMLMGSWGFIAHRDREGFYSTYFDTPAHRLDFWDHVAREQERNNHGPDVDVLAELWEMMAGEIATWKAMAAMEIEDAELSALKRLVDKYPDQAAALLSDQMREPA